MGDQDPTASGESTEGAGIASERGWTSLFIGGFLLVQIALPASYYLGDDRFDERFAWRMFSSVRLTECQLDVRRIHGPGRTEEVETYRDVQIAWGTLMKRNRSEVIRAYLRRRCERDGAPEVMVRTFCEDPEGRRSRHRWTIRCEEGRIERTDERLDR